MYEEVVFSRECKGIVVPDGNETVLPEGTIGYITQTLGGNLTVQLGTGYLVRIAGQDADAVGREVEPPPAPMLDGDGRILVDEDVVWSRLRLVFDPEIPVNIVELGLVYTCQVSPLEDKEDAYKVDVTMTLTAPGCGMGQVLRDDVEGQIRSIPGVKNAEVELVFDPPWGPERMTEAAKLELGFM